MKLFKSKSLFFRSTLIFIFFFSLFLSTHLFQGRFASSDDPYYHAKHALLIEQSGQLNLVKPWLEFHFLNFAPADYWWGFHLGLALFIHWFGLFLGVEIFVSFLAALVFLIFYLILNELKVKHSLVWVFLLLFSSTDFFFRLLLERPHLLAIIFLPLAFLVLIKGKNFWLFVLSLFYALGYVLAPLIILQTLFYLAVDAYVKKRINLRPLIASAGGVLAGVIIHPYSLNYLYGMFVQDWLVLFLRFTGTNLNLGVEVRFLGPTDFLQSNFLTLLCFVIAVVLFFSLNKIGKNAVVNNFLFLCSCFWLLVTLLVPRGVEYWLPVTLIFSAVMFRQFLESEEYWQIKNWLADKINLKVVGFFLVSALSLVMLINLVRIFGVLYNTNDGEINLNYQRANLWLKANTQEGSVVFYNSWDMWPMMFFYNDYNHYVLGMDATSMYEFDQRTYWLWRNIADTGLYCDQPKPCFNLSPRQQLKLVPLAIKTVFRAKYVVISNYEKSRLDTTLASLKNQAERVFKNKDLEIYEMK